MARPSATTALLLLALSLLAVAADHDTEPKSVAAMAVSDDNGLSSNPTRPAEDDASAIEEKVRPAEQQHGIEFLRLPSHQLHRHRPCSLHRHLWKRQHGVYRGAPRRFHDDHYSGHGERRDAVSHLAILPSAAEEAREAEEVKPVAETDSDRSLPDSDGEGELVATTDPSSFVDTDAHDGERAAAVRAWKKEVLRRWFHFHFHHGLRRHRLRHVHHEEEEEAAPETESMNMKRFQFHHHHHEEDDEKKNIVRKRLGHADHGHDMDSDDEDKQIEEMVRRFRQAIMWRRFSHGHGRRFFHHNHRHRHAEEAEKQAGGDKQSGVMAWIKALMNRF